MKLKITNPRIPLFFLLIALVGFIITLVDDGESDWSFYCGVMAAISCLLLMFVYFPIITIMLFGSKIENKAKVVINIGVVSLSLLVASSFMRLFDIAGGGAVIVIGTTFFYFNFLPAWYASKFKEADLLGRIFYFIFGTCLGVLMLGYQFKVMHWPLADEMRMYSLYTGLITLLPLGIILLLKKDRRYLSITSQFLFGFIIAYLLSGYLSSKMANKMFANNSTTYSSFEKNINLYQNKNKFLYEFLDRSTTKDTVFISYKNKTLMLKKSSDDLVNYIKKLKAYLIQQTDNLTELNPDSVSYDKIIGKTNYDIPTFILIGQDYEDPAKGEYSAIELKEKLQAYIKKTSDLAPTESVSEFKQSIPFDFSDVQKEDGQVLKWEADAFYHINLATIYSTLTNYQANVRYMEMNLLSDLFNKANLNNKDNIAGQMAELAMKYETTKKEKEISVLQKDKELNDVKMRAKDDEISNRERTITYFVFALIAFGVLIIFVIRSNFLRKQANKVLAQQKDIISAQKDEVENQKHLVEEKQKEIVDSITYAKRLQEAILPAQQIVDKYLPDNFILYTPKDLVAGDFYWMEIVTLDDKEIIFIAAADSTGHGVPGAMVSVVCSNALNRAVLEFKLIKTGEILDKTRELVLETFSKSTSDVKDGMDISLLAVIRKNGEISEINWSGANNPLWYIEASEVKEIKANKQPIGKTDNPAPFTTHVIPYVSGVSFYLFTDGYADQFGGPKGKKFKYKQLEELLLELSKENMFKQKETLSAKFEEWKSGIEQVDDVCVIGIKL